MSDEAVHYMGSTSRLRGEVERLRRRLEGVEGDYIRSETALADEGARAQAAEATMREVAEELRDLGNKRLIKLADRLDPPPKEHRDE